ncbi:hypothetical protein HOA92_03380 [archaeon]|jgi:Zn-dependent protease|nr:hypothetical protein [archaeon]MBT6762055.1 hypothetical protein [archaeon]
MYQSPVSKPLKIGPIKTSKTELIDIAKGWTALSFAFALLYSGTYLLGGQSFTNIFTINFFFIFLVSMFTAGLGFVLHELAHKFVAQHYGCLAEFRAFDRMLYLAVGLAAVVGWIFAAPGAVMISGSVTRKENGIISMAGPATNFVLAGIFFFIAQAVPIFRIGYFINAWLGLFNMIPFGNFDGKKILAWSKAWWVGGVVIGLLLLFVF